ncbi:hypothetical protein ACWD4B_15335 [Streptomyces sp. NPDC002536]
MFLFEDAMAFVPLKGSTLTAALRKKHLTVGTVAASGAALLMGLGLAQPAAATDLPHAPVAYFSAGQDLTGRQTPVDIINTACQNLAEPALSAVDFTAALSYKVVR